MANLSVESTNLQSGAGKINKLTNRVNSIHNQFERIRRAIDWDVMGEAQLERKMSNLLGELSSLSRQFNDAGTVLQDIENKYTSVYNDVKGLVGELPVTVNPLSNEEIGRIIGSAVGSLLFPGLGPVFGAIGGWSGSLNDNPIYSEAHGQFLGFDTYGKVGLSGFGIEYINENEIEIDEENIGYTYESGIGAYLAKGEVAGGIGLLSGDLTVKAVGGSVTGTAEFKLLEDGEFAPGVELGVNAEAYALNAESNVKFGNDDFNVHVGGEGYVCVAEASAGIQFNEDGIEIGGEVGAAVLKGEAKGGFTIFGITIDATVEGEVLSVGAGASFKVDDDSIELSGKLSALLGAGLKLKISW